MSVLSALIAVLLAYLLGSLVFGVIFSRLRGRDIRDADAPGGSGVYRQYGALAAVTVTLFDLLKGAAAVLLALALEPASVPWAVAAVVAGHNYPLFFRFEGGAGIAPLMGALLVAAPLPLLVAVAVGLLAIVPYRRLWQATLKLNAIPFAAAVAVLVAFALSLKWGGTAPLLAGAGVMALRSLQLLRRGGVA
ncbi:acyl-phosphate glycerol 3-phosphate acyltransferase [Deinobacterium chartae]|uniref:Acyl-phosphate glycerol 3-phosphate acyltransferase n=1 Tax=Deinobacterium chartae TaxID=521158 RepID=A0A841HYV6_9DEIO|nr:glycerol-3-phosphate acyltransferase [Deinobacterium chartae]MBB6098577.1 acyl-phosphate glycerol 3-phosphate acyltransferase [Deinobacterium chartae]